MGKRDGMEDGWLHGTRLGPVVAGAVRARPRGRRTWTASTPGHPSRPAGPELTTYRGGAGSPGSGRADPARARDVRAPSRMPETGGPDIEFRTEGPPRSANGMTIQFRAASIRIGKRTLARPGPRLRLPSFLVVSRTGPPASGWMRKARLAEKGRDAPRAIADEAGRALPGYFSITAMISAF